MSENQVPLLDYIKKVNDDNFIYVSLLGSSFAIIQTLRDCADENLLSGRDRELIQWYKDAITNVIYLKKPPPPIP